MAEDTAKMPYGIPPAMMMGRPPMPPPIGPNIASPTSDFCYSGYNPTFDGMFGHNETSNPYVNYLKEGTNITEFNINQLAYFNNMQGANMPDPNLTFFNQNLAGGLTKANQMFKNTMGSTAPKQEEKKH